MFRPWLVLFCFFYVHPIFAAEDLVQFDTPEQRELYQSLLKEYRCLKCQNQNLSDSNASLAGDLRREIRDRILSGMNKNAIDEYLVSRYGEFVLYRPRFTSKTAVLWIAPFVLFVIALTSVWMLTRRSLRPLSVKETPNANEDTSDSEKRAKARQLLEEEI